MIGVIENNTEEQRIMAAQLIDAATEWDAIASAAESVTEDAEHERASWDGQYKPLIHKSKMTELGAGNAGLAQVARGIADTLRAEAAGMNIHADDVDNGEAEAEATFDGIDTDLGTTGEGTFEV